ncbi:MAG: DMT family transporter [Lysobacterales bacterium]
MSEHGLYAAAAFAAGAGIPVMASLNGALARTLGSSVAASCVLFAVGLALSLALLILLQSWPALGLLSKAPAMQWLGGCIVLLYILTVTTVAPRFGIANTILFVMVAQILVSTSIDYVGAFGAAVRPLSPLRAFGLVLLLAGLALTQIGSATPVDRPLP